MSEFHPTLTPALRARLLNNVERLARLLQLRAPDNIVANEFGLLHRKAVAALGPLYWDAVHKSEYWLGRLCAGLCARCDAPMTYEGPNRGSGPEPLCATHLAEERAAEARWEAEAAGGYDWGPEGPPGG